MGVKSVRRGPHRTTVLLVAAAVGAMLIGTAGAAVGASLITSAQIKNGTIRAVDIKNNTITGKKIRNETIKSKDVKNGSLKGVDIKAGSLTGALVADGSLTGADIKAGSLTGALIADGSLTGAAIKAGSLTGALVADGSLTGAAIKAGSLTGAVIKDGSLTGDDLAANSITDEHLAPEARSQWAVVELDGTLARGTTGVTSKRVANSSAYHVMFPRAVGHCAVSATIGNSTKMIPEPGVITATTLVNQPKVVLVRTYDAAGNDSDRPFHLVAHC